MNNEPEKFINKEGGKIKIKKFKSWAGDVCSGFGIAVIVASLSFINFFPVFWTFIFIGMTFLYLGAYFKIK